MFVSRKNVLTWLMTLCLVSSAVARIVIFGLKGSEDSLYVWSQIVLPTLASVLYVLIVLVSGDELFYKTAVPVWMFAGYWGFYLTGLYDNKLIDFLFWVSLIFFAVTYTQVSSGKVRKPYLLPLLWLTTAVAGIYFHQEGLLHVDRNTYIHLLPDALFQAGMIAISLGLRVSPTGEYHPTWGDRTDGRRIRTLSPMAQITTYFQWERNICSNFFEESFEISHVERYIRQKRREGLTDFGITHVLLAAYVRAVAKYPQLNRFISGQRVFSRGEDIQYCMVIKKEMSVDSPDTSIKVHLNPRDTSKDVYEKLNAAVENVKSTKELDSDPEFEEARRLLKFLDYFGLLPRFLLELSPFHGSLFFTSMGSLGIPPIYHHLYDFGNLPVFGAFGMKRKANEVLEDGTVVQRKYIDVKFVMDERIVDGYYYATFFKHYRNILRHPEILDLPPEEVVRYID